MERYCIFEKAYEKPTARKMNLKIHPQTLMEFAKNVNLSNEVQHVTDPKRDKMVALLASASNSEIEKSFTKIDEENKLKTDFFSECNEEILTLYDADSVASSEAEMYCSILYNIFESRVIDVDIFMHSYYSILFSETKDDYVGLKQMNWTREEKETFTKARNNIRHNKESKRFVPYHINEKFKRKIEIQNFAPDLVRLYYLNKEYRNIFFNTQDSDNLKYFSSEISSVYTESILKLNRIEEIWLLERLLGINLARELYSLFSVILPQNNFALINVKYQPFLRDIIKEIMKLEGIYSRCFLVRKLKIITRIKISSMNCELNSLEFLRCLLSILRKSINLIAESYTNYEQSEYTKIKKEVDMEGLKEKCEDLINSFFYIADHYYCLNGSEYIAINNEKLYALIQKIIIDELKKY